MVIKVYDVKNKALHRLILIQKEEINQIGIIINMAIQSGTLILSAMLLVTALAQTVTQTTTQTTQTVVIPAVSSLIYTPVCRGDLRFLNANVAQAYMLQNNASNLLTQTQSVCSDPRLRRTITQSLKACDCPLIDHCTRVQKKGNVEFLNPCFARCEHSDTGYGDYKRCDRKFFTYNPVVSTPNTGIGRIVSSNLYNNQTCSQCYGQSYNPVCINGVEFSNECFARCFQPTATISSCVTPLAVTQISQNPSTCVCIGDVNPVCINQRRYMNECLAQCDFPGTTPTPC